MFRFHLYIMCPLRPYQPFVHIRTAGIFAEQRFCFDYICRSFSPHVVTLSFVIVHDFQPPSPLTLQYSCSKSLTLSCLSIVHILRGARCSFPSYILFVFFFSYSCISSYYFAVQPVGQSRIHESFYFIA